MSSQMKRYVGQGGSQAQESMELNAGGSKDNDMASST